MASFLITSQITSAIESIIIQAKKKLVIISPYIQISRTFAQRFQEAATRNVKITLIYGKNDLRESEVQILAGIHNLDIYFCENLHAKCYFNESTMVLTSMNLYNFSQVTNREMGLLIDHVIDKQVFEQAEAEAKSLQNCSERRMIYQEDEPGFCIRCGKEIDHNPSKPLCSHCFNTWNEFQNQHYEENFCHTCGEPEKTSMAMPECDPCYREWNKIIS